MSYFWDIASIERKSEGDFFFPSDLKCQFEIETLLSEVASTITFIVEEKQDTFFCIIASLEKSHLTSLFSKSESAGNFKVSIE